MAEDTNSPNELLYKKKFLKKSLFLTQLGDIISSKRYHPVVFFEKEFSKIIELKFNQVKLVVKEYLHEQP